MTQPGKPVTTVSTAYGRVDATVFEQLQSTFDTSQLLQAVSDLDALVRELGDPDLLRADVLRLHAMSHTVFNGGPISVPSGGETLPEVALDVEMQLDHFARVLVAIRDRVRDLVSLSSSDRNSDS